MLISLSAILVLGILAQYIAWRIRIPAILPLLIVGLLVGPFSSLVMPGGAKLLEVNSIFSDDFLMAFVSLSVGIILFEGGLTLRFSEVRHLTGAVRNLLTLGVLVTFVGVSLTAYYWTGLSRELALLFGALMTVTGPTVILPVLHNVRPKASVATVLKWEGILIDPIGALLAVLIFEFIAVGHLSTYYSVEVIKSFVITLSVGASMGVAGGLLLAYMIRRNRVPEYLRNEVALALVVFVFSLSEMLMSESGLMATTAMGIVLANSRLEEVKNILSFKEDISIILISVLFIVLSARVDVDQITHLGWPALYVLLALLFVIRPVSVFVSTWRSSLTWKEKLFIGLMGPRGIVAAAVASFFSFELVKRPEFVEGGAIMFLPLTFLIIVGSVFFVGLFAKPLAHLLGVKQRDPQGVLIVGAGEPARYLARYLRQKVPVVLADTSHSNIREARRMGLPVFEGDVLKDDVIQEMDLSNLGRLMAMTSNTEINLLAVRKFAPIFGEHRVFRLVSRREMELESLTLPREILFEGRADYLMLAAMSRQGVPFQRIQLDSTDAYEEWLAKNRKKVPLFWELPSKKVWIVTRFRPTIVPGSVLVYWEPSPSKNGPWDATNPAA